MSYFLGVDAGGTSTIAMVTDELGYLIGTGKAGNGNHQIGYERAKNNIYNASKWALEDAGITKADLTFSYFGLAGADRQADFDILQPMIEGLGFERFKIVCDTIIAMRAGTDQGHGVVVICGTGVNCSGRCPSGNVYQCGGFSYVYGDFGGGASLSIEGFRSVIRAWDGRGDKTQLTDLYLDYLGYETVDSMFHDFLDKGREVPADTTKLIFEAAREEDPIAMAILEEQGRELGLSAKAVINKLEMNDLEFDVVLAGSVLSRGHSPIIIKEIEDAILEVAPKSTITILTQEPIIGAILLAIEEVGQPITKEVYKNVLNVLNV